MAKRFTVKGHLEDLAKSLREKAAQKGWCCHPEEYMTQYLQKLRKGLLLGRFWVREENLSRSGDTRTLVVVIVDDDKIEQIWDGSVLDVMGISPGGRISGCNSDMSLVAQQRLFKALCPDKNCQTDMPKYNVLP